MSVIDDLELLIDNQSEQIDGIVASLEDYTSQNDQNISDISDNLDSLNENEGQLTFPLSQDTIDLIREQITDANLSYCGAVNSDGTVNFLPSGWTCAKTATGKYTITHNLNITSYVVMMSSNTSGLMIVNTYNANSVDVEGITLALSPTAQDMPFWFFLNIAPS